MQLHVLRAAADQHPQIAARCGRLEDQQCPVLDFEASVRMLCVRGELTSSEREPVAFLLLDNADVRPGVDRLDVDVAFVAPNDSKRSNRNEKVRGGGEETLLFVLEFREGSTRFAGIRELGIKVRGLMLKYL